MTSRSALIIDDEPDVTTYLGMVLGDNGWVVRTANTANRGLALAAEAIPDVILLDLMMPERGGMSTIEALRNDPRLSRIPIVLVTGVQNHLACGLQSTPRHSSSLQPDARIEKPVEPEILIRTLEEVLKDRPGQ